MTPSPWVPPSNKGLAETLISFSLLQWVTLALKNSERTHDKIYHLQLFSAKIIISVNLEAQADEFSELQSCYRDCLCKENWSLEKAWLSQGHVAARSWGYRSGWSRSQLCLQCPSSLMNQTWEIKFKKPFLLSSLWKYLMEFCFISKCYASPNADTVGNSLEMIWRGPCVPTALPSCLRLTVFWSFN